VSENQSALWSYCAITGSGPESHRNSRAADDTMDNDIAMIATNAAPNDRQVVLFDLT
jgi:hypothetical protein